MHYARMTSFFLQISIEHYVKEMLCVFCHVICNRVNVEMVLRVNVEMVLSGHIRYGLSVVD